VHRASAGLMLGVARRPALSRGPGPRDAAVCDRTPCADRPAPRLTLPRWAPQAVARGKRAPGSRAKAKGVGGVGEAALGARLQAAVGGRDVGLGPFHALGKLLYNKRLAAGDAVRTWPVARACSRGACPCFVRGSELGCWAGRSAR